jgi:beta-lactamase superfamily II metal-dependent hydrolase
MQIKIHLSKGDKTMKSRVIKIVSSLAIGIGIVAAPASSYAATPKTMKVHYIDVGQGDSIGRQMMSL